VAEAFEIGIFNLISEFAAHTEKILGALGTAGAIAAGFVESLAHKLYHFRVGIEFYTHSFIRPPSVI